MQQQPPTSTAPAVEVVSGSDGFRQRLIQLVASAHTALALFSHELDARVYGGEEFNEALKRFILQHRRARLRVIVHSPAVAIRRGHRLIELGRTLSSRIEFRQLSEDRRKLREEYLLADERALIYKEGYNDLDARFHAYDPLAAREQLRAFDAIWSECVPAREFSDLKI